METGVTTVWTLWFISACPFLAGKQAQGNRGRAPLGWCSKRNPGIGTQDPLTSYLSASETA